MSETQDVTICPLCGHRSARIYHRRGMLVLECVSPCYFRGPATKTVAQALAGAARMAKKRLSETTNA